MAHETRSSPSGMARSSLISRTLPSNFYPCREPATTIWIWWPDKSIWRHCSHSRLHSKRIAVIARHRRHRPSSDQASSHEIGNWVVATLQDLQPEGCLHTSDL